jgi:GDP-L-galactose phosphorylase
MLQAYYLAAPFPCERAPTVPLTSLKRKRGSVAVSRLAAYPVNGLVFDACGSLDDLAAMVAAVCSSLASSNTPHNLLITERGTRVFLWPQVGPRSPGCWKCLQGRGPQHA